MRRADSRSLETDTDLLVADCCAFVRDKSELLPEMILTVKQKSLEHNQAKQRRKFKIIPRKPYERIGQQMIMEREEKL